MTSRTCPKCGARTNSAWCCGIDLLARCRWCMTRDRIRDVHVLALGAKGLDEETYRLRLAAIGVESCKQFTRQQFDDFMRALRALPDARNRSKAA